MTNALIYVDDILLFSKDEESHEKFLTEFYSLVKSQGIMLSEKKMVIGQSSIDFLGVTLIGQKEKERKQLLLQLHTPSL